MKRIQRKRTAGWRMPANTVYVGRPGKWGNPFAPNGTFLVKMCVEMYRTYIIKMIKHDPVKYNLDELRGKDLACWCPDGTPCHVDVLLVLCEMEEWT